MITATLYQPQHVPQSIPADGLSLPDPGTGFARVQEQVATMLGCSLSLVDVLASSTHYVAYSVFDCQGELNIEAMTAVSSLTGIAFDPNSNDEALLGPILIVQQ